MRIQTLWQIEEEWVGRLWSAVEWMGGCVGDNWSWICTPGIVLMKHSWGRNEARSTGRWQTDHKSANSVCIRPPARLPHELQSAAGSWDVAAACHMMCAHVKFLYKDTGWEIISQAKISRRRAAFDRCSHSNSTCTLGVLSIHRNIVASSHHHTLMDAGKSHKYVNSSAEMSFIAPSLSESIHVEIVAEYQIWYLNFGHQL